MTKYCPLCPQSGAHCSTSWYSLPVSNYSGIFPWHKRCFNELMTKCSQCPIVPSLINLIPSFILPYIRLFSPFLCLSPLYSGHLFLLPCLQHSLITSPAPPFPSLTVSAFLFWQRRRASGDICILAGYVLGDEHAPICLGNRWDGCEKGEWRCRVELLFWQVVILGGVALIQHPGPYVRERLGAASLLLWKGRGRADAVGLYGIGLIRLRGPVFWLLLCWRSTEAGMWRMLSGDRGRGLAVRLRQGAQAPSYRYWGQVLPSWQILVEEVIIRVVILCVVWKGKEKRYKSHSNLQIFRLNPQPVWLLTWVKGWVLIVKGFDKLWHQRISLYRSSVFIYYDSV